jgi:tetratricopeptide (TPR) repeat protein
MTTLKRFLKLFIIGFIVILYSCKSKVANEKSPKTEVQEKLTILNKEIIENPNDAEKYRKRAVAFLLLNQFEKAKIDFARSFQLDSTNAQTWNNYGGLMVRKENYESAYRYYIKAIELEPFNSQYNNDVGNALLNLGRLKESIIYFDKAIELDSKMGAACLNKGVAIIGLGNPSEGCVLLKKSEQLGISEAHDYILRFCK